MYQGEWSNDMPNGKGTFASFEGWVYVGQFKDGLKHGNGKITYKDTSCYDGEWRNNVKQGQGEQTYFDDQGQYFGTYVGAFAADKRNGTGIFTYANGYTQSGEWKNDNFME
ncbi:MAG: hypothetical protein LBQ68_08815 [Clostridiales bacterium]|nr:hypothetical protein [Clostridiales bacterium]